MEKSLLYTCNPAEFMSFLIIQRTVDTDVMLIKIHMHLMFPTMIPCTL